MDSVSTALVRTRSVYDSAHSYALKAKSNGTNISNMLAPVDTGGMGQFIDYGTRRGYDQYRGWVYAAVNAIAEEAAKQPMHVGRMGNKATSRPNTQKIMRSTKAWHRRKLPRRLRVKSASEEIELIENHWLVDLFDRPNPIQHRWQFVHSFISNLCLSGWSFIVRDETEKGEQEFYSLPTTWLRVSHEEGPYSKFWIVNPRNPLAAPMSAPLDRTQVTFAYLPNPSDPLSALSPAQAQRIAIQVDDNIQISQANFFNNGIFPSVIVTVGQNPYPDAPPGRPRLSDTQRRQVYGAIRKSMQGVANYGMPAIIDGLIEKIDRFSLDSEEMGWHNSEKAVRTRILSAFSVHPFILGEEMVGSYAQAAIVEGRFYKRVNTYLDLLSSVMTEFIHEAELEKIDDNQLVWWEECKVEDQQQKLSAWNAARGREDVSQNEYRAEILGLPPDDDQVESEYDKTAVSAIMAVGAAVAAGQISEQQGIAILEGMGIPKDKAKKIAGKKIEQPAPPAVPGAPGTAVPVAQSTADQQLDTEVDDLEQEIKKLSVPLSSTMERVLDTVKSFRVVGQKLRFPVTAKDVHKFSSTQFNLPDDMVDLALQISSGIDKDDLADEGIETEPHITVKYGLHTDSVEEVRNAVRGFGPVEVKFGEISVFAAGDKSVQRGGDQYDVVKISIQSPKILELNHRICESLEYTDTYPNYVPHMTLAYVKPGLGQVYAESLENVLEGKIVVFDALLFSNKDREKTVVKLN